MGKKIRLGVLGATRGIDFGLIAAAQTLDMELAAVCDRFEPLLEKVRSALSEKGVQSAYFTDFDEMLRSDIDAVVIANNATDHAPFAIRALNMGKHVISEVLPMQTLSQAVALAEAVQASGKVYRYAENYCAFRNNFEARLRYRAGEIGELTYAEGDFYNDCSGRWHLLTRGLRNHWRNFVPATFYCTHSIGPVVTATGLRPVRVTGAEIKCQDYMRARGARSGSAAVELMEMENGAVFKSVHGNLKRPWVSRMCLTGTTGTLETNLGTGGPTIIRHTDNAAKTGFDTITPALDAFHGLELSPLVPSADAFQLKCFLGAINGDAELSSWGIDIWTALDMALPGFFAYLSILDGGKPVEIPDFRLQSVRDSFRKDNRCCDPRLASGNELLPSYSRENIEIPEGVYEREQQLLMEALNNQFHLGMN